MGLWIAARGCRKKYPEQAFNGTVFNNLVEGVLEHGKDPHF
jgi:hypothetical protein